MIDQISSQTCQEGADAWMSASHIPSPCDGRGIAGVTTTTTMGGPGNDNVDPRGDDDDNTTISLAMAAAMRVAGDE